jgi:hypothetical protein
MTTRVFEFPHATPAAPLVSRPAPPGSRAKRKRSLTAALLAALLVVPLAGAGEAPTGWLAASGGALAVLVLAAVRGAFLPWVWLVAAAGGLGLVLPRGPWPSIGPALFTVTVLGLVVWLATRDTRRHADANRSRAADERRRAAQVMLGLSGERHVGQVLADQLPQEYVLLNGLALPRGAGDIDHLVVGPAGVFLLETKTMSGNIVCQPDGTWRRTRVGRAGTAYDAYIGDPATQVQRNIFAVRQVLRKRLPDLFGRTSLWIEGLVVFAHPNSQLDTRYSRVPAVLLEDAAQRICSHTPRRGLQPAEVEAVVAALLEEARADPLRAARRSAQALVELALMLPVVLALVFGTIVVSRLVQTRTAVIAVAHEAARAGALANSPAEAATRMRQRAELVAPGFGLDPRRLALDSDVSRFSTSPAEVVASAQYPVDFGDLPMFSGLPPVLVRAEHVEWVEPFRSGIGLNSPGEAAD